MKASLIRASARNTPSKNAKRVALSLQVADQLEAAIAEGKFKGKTKLPSQEELCARFSVSSSVIREAIHLLKAKDIVYTLNGVGSFIAERSVDPLQRLLLRYVSGAQEAHDYSELMELRLAIETTCAEKLAEHNSVEAMKSLHASMRTMEVSSHRLPVFADADLAFHSAIVDYSGNSLFKAIHSSLRPTMRWFMDLTCTESADFELNRKEHRRIYAAICAGDAAEASRAVRDHILYARRHYGLLVLAASESVQRRARRKAARPPVLVRSQKRSHPRARPPKRSL